VITVAVLLSLSVLPHMRPLDGETRQQQQQAGQEGRQGLLCFMFDRAEASPAHQLPDERHQLRHVGVSPVQLEQQLQP
jgi:hypothetical protein